MHMYIKFLKYLLNANFLKFNYALIRMVHEHDYECTVL